MAVPLSFVAVNDPLKGIVVLPHAHLPPTHVMAHSHRLILGSHGLFHFKNDNPATSPVVQIEYTRPEWATGHVFPDEITGFSDVVQQMINDKSRKGWEFFVHEIKPHWFLSKAEYVRGLCHELIDQMRSPKYRPPGVFLASPEIFPYKPKYIKQSCGNAVRLEGWAWPTPPHFPLHHYNFPEPARCLVELYKDPNDKSAWMACYWNKFTGAYFIEIGPGIMETAQSNTHFSRMLDTTLHGPGEVPTVKCKRVPSDEVEAI